ncbi:MAG: hydroxyacid dehydrogenase [Chloroflexota bacterium]
MTVSVRPRVVVADPLGRSGLDLLREHLEVVETEPETLFQVIGGSDALVVRSRTKVTAALLDRASGLKLVARAGIGVDNIDVPAASERGVLVINAPLGNVLSTAEHTLALIFALARRVIEADRAVRDGFGKTGYEGVQLSGKQLGVVGVGKVGRTVGRLALALGMSVVAHDPYVPAEAWPNMSMLRVSLEELLATSDVISLHVPFSHDTRYLIDSGQIRRMKRGSYLVNCARGGLVRESALVEALTSRHLAGAALDVFEDEPPRDLALLSAPNLLVTPHVAASTREAQAQVSVDIAEGVLDFFAGRPATYPINPSVLIKV